MVIFMKYVSDVFPKWGPYSKKYMGISRIADHEFADGVRFDVTVSPAVANSHVLLPNVTTPSGVHPWSAKEDLSFYSYRYDLDGKDKVFADVSFTTVSDDCILIRTEFVNNTELNQNCILNFFCSVEYPHTSYCNVHLPDKSVFIDAVNYENLVFAYNKPNDRQTPDGMKRGEFLDELFTGNHGLGDRVDKWHLPEKLPERFGAHKSDSVSYNIEISETYKNAVLAVRYRTVKDKSVSFMMNGENEITFPPSNDLNVLFIPLGEVNKGNLPLEFTALGTGEIEFDCFVILESGEEDKLSFNQTPYEFIPETEEIESSNGYEVTYNYKNIPSSFHLNTYSKNTCFRTVDTGALEDCLISRVTNADPTFDDLTESFTASFKRKHSDDGFFHNTIIHTIYIEPHEKCVEYVTLSCGDKPNISPEKFEEIYLNAKNSVRDMELSKAGAKYQLSNQILKATLLTNTVYPIYKHGEYIVHNTPGKRWDCLYTWDSGFIGLAMVEHAPKTANYILDTYLSSTDNPDYAFLHHGSPVPVQIYQYLEMLNHANDKSELLKYYDRAKLFYDFLVGRTYGSTTARFKSGLLTTYDYFYSSSGMDDYPAQAAMNNECKRYYAAPAITSSQVIRCAKILKAVADELHKYDDIAVFNSDIAKLTGALQKYSWDNECGYFSYVLHDDNNNPVEIYRTESGENLNKGTDGIYPIIAGACTKEQEERILSHLKNEKKLLSPYGLSAVDMSAGYFTVNGYWNGNVWFPHQWFVWKTMLDLGETDFAFKIADIALRSWKREVDDSFYTFEMLNVVTGRGGWFHNFGGLSAPINMWTASYYKPGTITGGFDIWHEKTEFDEKYNSCDFSFRYYGEHDKFSFIVVMNDDEKMNFRAELNGKEVQFYERNKGILEFTLDGSIKNGVLRITSI